MAALSLFQRSKIVANKFYTGIVRAVIRGGTIASRNLDVAAARLTLLADSCVPQTPDSVRDHPAPRDAATRCLCSIRCAGGQLSEPNQT
jgi:hypothetical protein